MALDDPAKDEMLSGRELHAPYCDWRACAQARGPLEAGDPESVFHNTQNMLQEVIDRHEAGGTTDDPAYEEATMAYSHSGSAGATHSPTT